MLLAFNSTIRDAMPVLVRSVVQHWKDATRSREFSFRHCEQCSITSEATFIAVAPSDGSADTPLIPGNIAAIDPGATIIEKGLHAGAPYLSLVHNPPSEPGSAPVFAWPAKLAGADFIAESAPEIHRIQLDRIHNWLTGRADRFDDLLWDGDQLLVRYRGSTVDRFRRAELLAHGALPDPNAISAGRLPYEFLPTALRSSFPIRRNVPGAPFKIGESLFISLGNDHDDGTLTPEELAFWNHRQATVRYFDYSGGGQSYPANPLIGVEAATGEASEFWAKELQSAGNSAPLPTVPQRSTRARS